MTSTSPYFLFTLANVTPATRPSWAAATAAGYFGPTISADRGGMTSVAWPSRTATSRPVR